MESGLDNSPMYDCGKVSLVFSIPIQGCVLYLFLF
jgi:hypothetical protein